MEEELLLLLLMSDDEDKSEEVLKKQRRMQLKSLRDASDPFTLPEREFIKNFRMSRSLCRKFLEDLLPYDDQKTSLPFQTRVLAVLYFFGHGSYQKCIGKSSNVPMSQPSISRSLHSILKLILKVKGGEVTFPQSVEAQNNVKIGFHRKFGIKVVIGAIDCTHIAIIAPCSTNSNHPLNTYMNRKGYYSINVEAVCDTNLIFTSINAKFPGATQDSDIWATSSIREWLIRSHTAQREYWLLGDQGYPLEPWLFTPIAVPHTAKEKKYNAMHASARNTIERACEVLKSRFRCLSKQSVLHYSHETAAKIIYCCVILHNIMRKCSASTIDFDIEDAEEVDSLQTGDINSRSRGSEYTREGERIRRRYIESLL